MNDPATIIFDFGDTIADEGTEQKDAAQVTLRAELFPGAAEALEDLARAGHRLGLLADCVPGTGQASYDNVLQQHQIDQLFSAIVTSDQVGANKPDPRMFETILKQLGVSRGDYSRVIMIGNRLQRDILGGNRLGMVTVWADLSDRYKGDPEVMALEGDPLLVPDYEFSDYRELLPLLADIGSHF
jgi:HAD superfamily hydrolase (TIGR01549 family)